MAQSMAETRVGQSKGAWEAFLAVTPPGSVVRISAAKLMGVGALFALAWIVVYLPTVVPETLREALAGDGARLAFHGGVTLAVLAGIPLANRIAPLLARPSFSWALCAVFAAGVLLCALAPNPVAAGTGLALVIVAYAALAFVWGSLFRYLSMRQAMTVVLASLVAAVALFFIVAFLAQPAALALTAAVPVLSCALASSCRKDMPGRPLDSGESGSVRLVRSTVLFMMLFSFACGFVLTLHGGFFSNPSEMVVIFSFFALVAAALLALAVYRPPTHQFHTFVLGIVALVVIAGLLGAALLPAVVAPFSLGLVVMANLLIDVLFWALLATVTGEGRVQAFRSFCWCYAALAAAKMAGIGVADLLLSEGAAAAAGPVVCAGVAYAIVVFIVVLWAWRTGSNHSDMRDLRREVEAGQVREARLRDSVERARAIALGERDEGSVVEDACGLIADQYRLTPREGEVLLLMARGRNAGYIQKELVLSTSTVKTHIKHVYNKLGVHSAQEVIDFVERYRR